MLEGTEIVFPSAGDQGPTVDPGNSEGSLTLTKAYEFVNRKRYFCKFL